MLLTFPVKLDGNALGAGLFPVSLAEPVEVADPPNSRTRQSFENSSLTHGCSFLDFGGRPAPDSFDHFLNVFVSYFLARAFPPFFPILRRNSRTSSPGVSFLDTPRVCNLAARLSSGLGRMIGPQQALEAIAWY